MTGPAPDGAREARSGPVAPSARSRWSRWHVRLGWLAALPLIMWTATGLFMTSFPIEQVRGGGVVRDNPPIAAAALAGVRMPATLFGGTRALALRDRAGTPVWIATGDAGDRALDAATGAMLPSITAPQARAIAVHARVGRDVPVAAMAFTRADRPPVILRKPRATWHVRFADGVDMFVDARTGMVLATRTRLWRVYDFAWGLHILDPLEREDTNHPLLTLTALAALATIIAGAALLAWRRR